MESIWCHVEMWLVGTVFSFHLKWWKYFLNKENLLRIFFFRIWPKFPTVFIIRKTSHPYLFRRDSFRISLYVFVERFQFLQNVFSLRECHSDCEERKGVVLWGLLGPLSPWKLPVAVKVQSANIHSMTSNIFLIMDSESLNTLEALDFHMHSEHWGLILCFN